MTHFDDDGPIGADKKSNGKSSDRLMAGAGILLASAAAFFPWYVFFNEDKFGINVAAIDHTRDLPTGFGRNVFSVSPMAMINRNRSDEQKPIAPVDPLTTATVSKLGDEKPNSDAPVTEQAFPGKSGFKLLHVANGRALIEDGSGMYMVRVGSILPDNSRLATLEQRDGKWVIVSSTGQVTSNN